MIFIYNHDEEQVNILDAEYRFTREINKLNILEFESDIEFEKGYRAVIKENGKYYEFIIIDSEYSRFNQTKFVYYCQDSFIENQGFVVMDKRPSGNFKQALNSIFKDNNRWTVSFSSDYSDSYEQSNSFFRISFLEAFEKIVEDYNLEWHTEFEWYDTSIINRTLVISKIGKKASSRLEFGKNIKSFKRKVLSNNVITALCGYGKGEESESGSYGRRINFSDINSGKEYVENLEALKKYGIGKKGYKQHVFGFFIDENETDKRKLLETTKKELERVSQVQAEYTVEASNINIDGGFGDTIDIVDEEIDFKGSVRIIKAVKESEKLIFTFGNIVKNFSDSIQSKISKSTEKIKTEITSILNQRIEEIQEQYFGEDGFNYDLRVGNEYGLPAGLYSFDKPIDENPTKFIYYGAGKILIGEIGENGKWIFRTAIDSKGVAGSEIITGTVTADKLASDVGQSLDLSSNEYIQSIVSNNSDISDEVYKKISELNNLLEDKISESTINKLLEEINSQLNINSTKINQNKNKLEIEFNSVKAEIENNRTDLNTLTSTITSGQDDDGNAYTEWGSTSDAKVRVGANGIDIISNDQEVMSFKDGEAYAKALYVTETIGFGNHTAQKYGTKYTVFSWNGGK